MDDVKTESVLEGSSGDAVGNRRGAGRKLKEQSRADVLRRRLTVWQQIAEQSRPSLRTLAMELGTSHQLLQHYLRGLNKWQAGEYWRQTKEIRARANGEGRFLTPWEEQQIHTLDRRATYLYIEGCFEEQVMRMEREIGQDIDHGHMPAPHTAKMLRSIASTHGVTAQRAQALLQKYYSPEAQKDLREKGCKVRRRQPLKSTPKLSKAEYHKLRLLRLTERFEEIGGVLLLDEGRVLYFVPEETAVAHVLIAELANYHDQLRERLEQLSGKVVDFEKFKTEICQRFPAISLSPLKP